MAPGPGFEIAVALLFAVPGPTNALLLLGGARRGAFAVPALIGAAVGAFLIAVALLIGLFGPLLAARPSLGLTLRLGCAAILMLSAWRLWRSAGAEGSTAEAGRPSAVFAATLVNPKALIFAFAIFPPLASLGDAVLVFVRFACVGAVVMTAWGLAGAALGAGVAPRLAATTIDRIGSLTLVVFSFVLLTPVFAS